MMFLRGLVYLLLLAFFSGKLGTCDRKYQGDKNLHHYSGR